MSEVTLNPLECALDETQALRRQVDSLQAENTKLREQIHWLKKGDILHVLTDQEYIDQCERERLMQVGIDALDKENSRLRELCKDLAEFLTEAEWLQWPELRAEMQRLVVEADE
jgi:hypothetical protein